MIDEAAALRYRRLNDSINSVIFDGRYRDTPVYLDVEGDLKDEICEELGLESSQLDEYVGEVVSETLLWEGTIDIYLWHSSNNLLWSSDDTQPPPFTALLLALSIAAENMSGGDNFSSINFYGRVAELFGAQKYKELLNKYSETTSTFWKSLNQWLTTHDYNYGRPTAQPILKNWKYASYALSQALVRRSDRDCFHRLFLLYNISKTDHLTQSEIEPYIYQWMMGTGPTKLLKKIWKDPTLRDRVVEAAIEELNNWSGIVPNADGHSPGKLFWIIKFRSYPIKQATITLCAITAIHDRKYDLFENDFASSQESPIAKSVNLNRVDGQDFASLGPISSLSLEDIISSHLILKEGNIDSFSRKHRSIIPLLKQENGHFYKEVSQALLFHEYKILCASNWKNKIVSFLKKYGNPDYHVIDQSAGNGIPVGWSLFSNVEIVKVPNHSEFDQDLYALMPSERGLAFYPSGGLRLSNSSDVWHRLAPPNIFAVNKNESLGIEALRAESGTQKILISITDSLQSPNFLYRNGQSILKDTSIEQLDIRTISIDPKVKKLEKKYQFRSADIPRKHPQNQEWKLNYSFPVNDDRKEWFSANEQYSKNYLRGLDTSSLQILQSPKISERYKIKIYSGDYELKYQKEKIDEIYKINLSQGNNKICFSRGVHAWEMPDGVTAKTKIANMKCVDCGARGIHRGQKAKIRTNEIKNIKSTKMQVSENINTQVIEKLSPKRILEAINHDIILDALSYEGGGSANLLYQWFSFLVSEPWLVKGTINDYVALGFIDIKVDVESSRIKKWSIAPPTLVINEDGQAFLSGFRSNLLVNKICLILDNLSIPTNIQEFDNQPKRYNWMIAKDIENDVIDALSKSDLPYKIAIAKQPAAHMQPYMPSLQNIVEDCPVISPPLSGIEKFHIITGSWKEWRENISEGAYRNINYPRRHFYTNGGLVSKRMSYELVKICAAYNGGYRLQDYDAQTNEFSCILGCNLPGLYERILVSCSGTLPERASNKKIIYKNIPYKIGNYILERLYG